MRVVFMGTPEFAVPSLRALHDATEVVAVYTKPDAVRGRGSRLVGSAVKGVAEELGLPLEQPATLRDPDAVTTLVSYRPDLVVVAAYGLILPADILSVPPLGTVNVHGSLLPRWRGAAPVQRAILAGDPFTGVAIMQMEEGLDTGPYCEVRRVQVGEMDASALSDELARLGADALIAALPCIESRSCAWQPQDESLVTYADKLTRADVELRPTLTVEEAWRRVRASGPSAPSRVTVGGAGVTVVEVWPSDVVPTPGRVVVSADGVVLGLSDGGLALRLIKPDGKAAMDSAAWARGARLDEGATWSAPVSS